MSCVPVKSIKMSAIIGIIALLLTLVNDISGACVQVPNDDMIEYSCENGSPYDLYSIPERTEKIRISTINLPRITRDTFSRFGDNLWVLACTHCGINDIDSDAFQALTNLQQLRLDNNHLKNVRASWFEGLKYLTYLDFNYNEIQNIEDGVFDNLPSLVDLRISGNKLECLNVDEISRLPDLKRMFLNRNPEFKCPNAISRVLELKDVIFEKDPEWSHVTLDLVQPGTSRPSSTTPMYRERIIVSRPTEAPADYYPTSSAHNYPPTSAPYPIHDYSTQESDRPSGPSSNPSRPDPSEEWPHQGRNWPTQTRPEYTPSTPYNEPYYPPQAPRSSTSNPYRETIPANFPTSLPTSTARISWSANSDEIFNETDYPPIETAVPSYRPMPTGPPLREDPEDYEAARPQLPVESYPKPHPLENYQQIDQVKSVTVTTVPTTDKPLPKCGNSAESISVSLGFLIIMLFYSVSRTV